MLLNLFNDILDLSSLEATLLNSTFAVKILELCLQLEQQYGHKTQADVKLILDGGDANTFVSADWNRTIQIVSNLLSNAVKFTSRGEIHFGFLNKENFVEFYVRDTGIGIPAERAATIFQRFGKVDDFVQGTGLGLTLCKMLVEKMGGHIRVCSKENEVPPFISHFRWPTGKLYASYTKAVDIVKMSTAFVFMKIAVTSFLHSVLLHLAFPYTLQDHSIPLLLPANHHHPSVAR